MASNMNNKFRSFPGGESNGWSTAGSGGRAFPSAFGKNNSSAPREEPYHVRKAREDAAAAKSAAEKAERGREFNDVNFPALGGASSAWGGGGGGKKTGGSVSFAALASDWKARDEEEKERAEIAEMRRQREEAERIAFTRVRPPAPSRFGYSHSRQEDTYEEENYQDDERHYYRSDSPRPADDMDDGGGWTSVARPVKKPRTMRSFAPLPPDTGGADGGGEWGTDHTSRGHEQDSIW